MTPDEIVTTLGLEPHPEGGWYRRTYRSTHVIEGAALPAAYDGTPRIQSSAIYYLVTVGAPSRLHRVRADELFHHYAGDDCEQLQLVEGGPGALLRIGSDLMSGARPQVVVPAGAWQGLRVRDGGQYGWALLGCTVSPGFEFDDFELGTRVALMDQWPDWTELIADLT